MAAASASLEKIIHCVSLLRVEDRFVHEHGHTSGKVNTGVLGRLGLVGNDRKYCLRGSNDTCSNGELHVVLGAAVARRKMVF
jgi:hypothetical protein